MVWALYRLIAGAFQLYSLLIIIQCVLTWIPMAGNSVTRIISEVTEPYLSVFRNLLYRYYSGPVDFSPILALLVLRLLQRLVLGLFIRVL